MFAGPSLADRERHLENKDGFRASCQSNIKRTQGSDRTVRLKFLITIKFANCLLLHEFLVISEAISNARRTVSFRLDPHTPFEQANKKTNKQKQAEPIFFTRFLESAWRSHKTVPLLINCRPGRFICIRSKWDKDTNNHEHPVYSSISHYRVLSFIWQSSAYEASCCHYNHKCIATFILQGTGLSLSTLDPLNSSFLKPKVVSAVYEITLQGEG